MTRSRRFALAAILAGGLTGCAHCDTCDDFPVPCTGPGCNASMRTMGPGPVMAGPMTGGAVDNGGQVTTPTFSPPALPEAPAEAAAPAPEAPAEVAPVTPDPNTPPPPPRPENP